MRLLYHHLKNKFINNELLIFGVFTVTASILGYYFIASYLNYDVIIIFFCIKNLMFLSKKFQIIKQKNHTVWVSRFTTMLFLLIKFKGNYDLLFYSLCITIVILLGIAWYKHIRASATICPNMIETVNSETVDYKFEFNLPNEQIEQIKNFLGRDVTNNAIKGENADYIINRHNMPLIKSSEIHSYFYEIFNHF